MLRIHVKTSKGEVVIDSLRKFTYDLDHKRFVYGSIKRAIKELKKL